jgi:hypothetical protein
MSSNSEQVILSLSIRFANHFPSRSPPAAQLLIAQFYNLPNVFQHSRTRKPLNLPYSRAHATVMPSTTKSPCVLSKIRKEISKKKKFLESCYYGSRQTYCCCWDKSQDGQHGGYIKWTASDRGDRREKKQSARLRLVTIKRYRTRHHQ